MTMLPLPDWLAPIPADQAVTQAILDRLGFLPGVSPEERAQIQAVLDARYVLIRNDGPERLRCGRCGAKHAHLTLMCKERPFRGVEHGLYAYYGNVGAYARESLTGQQKARLSTLAPIFTTALQGRSFDSAHPQTARELGTADRDADLAGVLLGTVDPITESVARRYAAVINIRAGRTLVRL